MLLLHLSDLLSVFLVHLLEFSNYFLTLFAQGLFIINQLRERETLIQAQPHLAVRLECHNISTLIDFI